MVKFYYDPEKCDLPLDIKENRPIKCLKCLDACPYSLIMFRPMKKMSEDGAPLRYEIYMTFKAYSKELCPNCLKCVKICPSQAINIVI